MTLVCRKSTILLLLVVNCFVICVHTKTGLETQKTYCSQFSECFEHESCVTIHNTHKARVTTNPTFSIKIQSVIPENEENFELTVGLYDSNDTVFDGVLQFTVLRDERGHLTSESAKENIPFTDGFTELKIEIPGDDYRSHVLFRKTLQHIVVTVEDFEETIPTTEHFKLYRLHYFLLPHQFQPNKKDQVESKCMNTSEWCAETDGWQIQTAASPARVVKCSWDHIEMDQNFSGSVCCCKGACDQHQFLSHNQYLPNETSWTRTTINKQTENISQAPSCAGFAEKKAERSEDRISTPVLLLLVFLCIASVTLLFVCIILAVGLTVVNQKYKKIIKKNRMKVKKEVSNTQPTGQDEKRSKTPRSPQLKSDGSFETETLSVWNIPDSEADHSESALPPPDDKHPIYEFVYADSEESSNMSTTPTAPENTETIKSHYILGVGEIDKRPEANEKSQIKSVQKELVL